jgi:integrase
LFASLIKLKGGKTIMDLPNLQKNYPRLISYLVDNGYAKRYVARFNRDIQRILHQAKPNGWKSYTDAYLAYVEISKSPSYLREKRTVIGAIERFESLGLYPNRQRHQILRNSSYDLVSAEFKSLIDHYRESEMNKGKKRTTIYTESHNATTFLLALHQKGINSFKKITESAVLEIFFQNGRLCRSCSYKKNIAAVLKAGISFFPKDTCARILSYLPALRETRKNIQYLTQEEVSRLKVVFTDRNSIITLRDKAIGLLALYTGMRSCDIAGLTVADIDWVNDLIRIRQQKTDIPLEIPLTATVGNAIYEYLIQERPQSRYLEIFLSRSTPHTRLQSGSFFNIAKKIMTAAKIRTNAGDRNGFHIFRHHLATSLLGNDVPQPVISQILGHTSPASLNAYLNADLTHLKECALSIECFPLRKEVCYE